MSKVGIFGAGWVGLVTGACFAELVIVSMRVDDPQGDAERSDDDFWPA